ncbi:MAG: hypothetical protein ABSH22_15465 [Tepidisphaeraceae bacterium]
MALPKRRLVLFALIALASAIGKSASAAAPATLPDTQPTADHGGTIGGVRITVAMENKEIKIGEPVVLDVFVDNFSSSRRLVIDGEAEQQLAIAIRDSKERAVPWTRLGAADQDPNKSRYVSGDFIIPPMKTWCYRLRLDELADLTKDDTYTAAVSIKIRQRQPLTPPEMWEKTLESNQATFVITGSIESHARPIESDLISTGDQSPTTRPSAGP